MLYPILALLFAGPSLSTEDPNGSQAVCGNPVTPITPRTTNPQKLTDFMKLNSLTLQTVLMTWTLAACGQGTMIYDQQSATNRSISGGAPIQEEQPIGQSFTPALSSVGFVQFEFIDAHPGNGMGATVYVNLRTDSLTGSILDSTAPVFMPDGFSYGITSFFFATPAGVSPGTTYYLQPVVQSGDGLWGMIVGTYNYSDGTFFANGVPNSPGFDAWFREGVIIPEPSSGLLALAGVAAIWVAGRVRQVRARYLATLLIGLLASAGVASAQLQIGERVSSPPRSGSFHSMQRSAYPPLPCLPFDVPVYRVAGRTNSYVYDDRTIDYDEIEQAQRAGQAQASLSMRDISDQTLDEPVPLDYGTNLWLDIADTGTNSVLITAHNVDSYDYFQLFSRTNILGPDWMIEQQSYYSTLDSPDVILDPVPENGHWHPTGDKRRA